MKPTEEQEDILAEPGNCVVIAKPGSGKTYTLAEKIRQILPALPHYKGVIAISYTNKASNELERRTAQGGVERKSSFFGTIDKFLLTEVIRPFGPRVFGEPTSDLTIVAKPTELDDDERNELGSFNYTGQVSPIAVLIAGQVFSRGRIWLPAAGAMAVHILNNSPAARRYLRARYTHIIVDEYQDCDYWQHRIFVGLVKSGLIGIAVGDVDQSIYVFANKDPKYLRSLLKSDGFRAYALNKNHRSPQSIVDYSTQLLAPTYQPIERADLRVALARIAGDERDIGTWLNEAVPLTMRQWELTDCHRVAILVRNSRSAALILPRLAIPYYYREETPLDYDTTLWGMLFRKVLGWLFNADVTKYDLIASYLDVVDQPALAKRLMESLRIMEEAARENYANLISQINRFEQVAKLLLPHADSRSALSTLENVLLDPKAVASFAMPRPHEVHMMTIHKSKGLEFDIVFHMDLYEHILPIYGGDYQQELNLHYVAITRARKYCVLCTSDVRTDGKGNLKKAAPSPFLTLNDVQNLRVEFSAPTSS